jgi:transposase, IS5 family
MGQLSFASLDFEAKKKRTKRDVFLSEMAGVVPWGVLEGVIEPHYPKIGPQGGRRPFPLGVMLRMYCLQQWYTLSDPGAATSSGACSSVWWRRALRQAWLVERASRSMPA